MDDTPAPSLVRLCGFLTAQTVWVENAGAFVVMATTSDDGPLSGVLTVAGQNDLASVGQYLAWVTQASREELADQAQRLGATEPPSMLGVIMPSIGDETLFSFIVLHTTTEVDVYYGSVFIDGRVKVHPAPPTASTSLAEHAEKIAHGLGVALMAIREAISNGV